MNGTNGMKHKLSFSGALTGLLMAGIASADELNMPVGVTEISRQVYDLHMTLLWICVAIGVVVFGVMFWSIIHHRRSQGR